MPQLTEVGRKVGGGRSVGTVALIGGGKQYVSAVIRYLGQEQG